MNAALVAARAVHFGATMLVFGELVFVAFVAGGAWRRAVSASPPATGLDRHAFVFSMWALAASALSGIGWLLLEAMQMADATVATVIANGAAALVLRQTEFGHVFALRALLWLVLVVSVVAIHANASSITRRTVTLLAASAYLATLADAGHAAAANVRVVHAVHVGGDALHLLAAGAWLGALAPLVHCLAHAPSTGAAARIARRFSVLGIACVAALIASGIVNSLFLVGSFPALFGTAYGQLLVVKLVLFAAMLAIAATNRFHLTPRLAGHVASRRSLARNALLELAAGVVIVGIVGALGTMVPGAHQSPQWPFGFTLDFGLDGLSLRLLGVLAACSVAALAAIAFIITGMRRSALRMSIPGVIALLALAAVSTSIFAVPAFPTTYATSPVPYTVDAVSQGAARFAAHCSSCHGADARGDGPLAATLKKKPANLAEHALHHPQGNLFWWIAHGIAGSPMPAFSAQMSDKDIWQIVQYLVARASAEASMSIGPRVDDASMSRAPDFSFEAAADGQRTLAAERTPALIVLYSLPQSDARLSQLASDHRLTHGKIRVIAIPLPGSPSTDDDAALQTRVGANVSNVYAMFAPARGKGAPVHAELLVDGSGIVRARWLGLPDDGSRRDGEIVGAAQHLPARSSMPASMHHGH
jgi:putative copper export protein/mono/diheme cytochrome c family protein